jgi:hypothetical protein
MFVCEAVTQQRPLYICFSRGRCPETDLNATVLNNDTFDNQERVDKSKAKSRNVICRPTARNYQHTDTATCRQDSVVHPPRCWLLRLAPRRPAADGCVTTSLPLILTGARNLLHL